MKKINTYIIEKLHINKDTKIPYEIEYDSAQFDTEIGLKNLIFKNTKIKNCKVEKISDDGIIITTFKISVYKKEDYLLILVFLFDQIASKVDEIKDSFYNRLEKVIPKKNRKKYLSIISEIFTIDEIYDGYEKYKELFDKNE